MPRRLLGRLHLRCARWQAGFSPILCLPPGCNSGISLWSVSLEGEVAKPRTFTMDEIVKLAPLEERIYRRSIVVPWIGYSFNALVKLAQPTSKAR